MKPTVALVGRPNVGKSTLFNRLTRSRDAIVADIPGLTRDRHYGHGRVGEKDYLVVDTGGFEPIAKDGILHEMAKQTLQAVDEADVVMFIVDGRNGLTAQDAVIADKLRRSGRKVWLVVNKAEGMNRAACTAEFFELGLGEPLPISASHGDGVRELMEEVLQDLPDTPEPETKAERHPRLAVVGRPNVGKSTLVNSILGEERVIAFDQPGTTRDSIHIDFERNGKPYTVVDTAGIRKRGKVTETIEKFSVIKTLQSAEDANVVVLVLDAHQEISDQDAAIAGFILESGRALVVAVNKWDALDSYQRDRIKREIDRKLQFLDFAKFHFISALHGKGVAGLFQSIDEAYAAAMAKLSTPRLTRVLLAAVQKQAPPKKGMFRPKMRYAHQGGVNPPIVVIHGAALDNVPESYVRYLARTFSDAFKLQGTPLRVQFKQTSNPYSEKD
ncbi:ribosome biogenesis GTPase Der [Chitinivorax sp. PXF-14]|uniref:ribosome biogenesis GTPase Der n=1 Tax=Chitinivorax sp. PXF-14 TaxID=3230488 RepID=UPI003464FAE7